MQRRDRTTATLCSVSWTHIYVSMYVWRDLYKIYPVVFDRRKLVAIEIGWARALLASVNRQFIFKKCTSITIERRNMNRWFQFLCQNGCLMIRHFPAIVNRIYCLFFFLSHFFDIPMRNRAFQTPTILLLCNWHSTSHGHNWCSCSFNIP